MTTTPTTKKPVIGIVADFMRGTPHENHAVGNKYIRAVVEAMDAIPLLIPALGEDSSLDELLEIFDGLLLAGAYSNVEPKHYQGEESDAETLHDPDRDATSLPLISRAIETDVPILGICRGFQEINVALGGTLHQKVHQLEAFNDHREDKNGNLDQQYEVTHSVTLTPDGIIEQAIGKPSIMVNSLHEQGIERLADTLTAEAIAPDGLIEAFSLKDSNRFVLGAQWHPEWKVMENSDYRTLFELFKQACLNRQ